MSQASSKLLDSSSIRAWSTVRTWNNLVFLALDYVVAAIATGLALWFHFRYQDWGLSWWWHLPVWGAAVIINGCVTHRIGLMGHEASHNLLVPNRKWNDVLAELLCFYPVFGSLLQYRAKHLRHHLYPNDPDQDPNLGNGKAERLYAKFPMPKPSFIYHYYLKFFWPPFVFANLLDLLDVITIGSGMSPVPVRDATDEERQAGKHSKLVRVRATILGIAYLVALCLILRLVFPFGPTLLWPLVAGLYVVAVVVWKILPESAFFQGARLSIPIKQAALLRITCYTLLFSSLAVIRQVTGWDPTAAFLILWIVPLIYVFPYLMLLREVYQHANAGQGPLDNSRIIHADPFTRWAVLGYGNDFHLIHHIYPNIPQYALRGIHRQLMEESPAYRDGIEETRGILKPRTGAKETSLLDSLSDTGPMPHRSSLADDPSDA
ncbi:MAG: fatty acid desaturase [Verrucomicrobiae bacterium]|nr:fatty acid desaturase [Verrucomicrobiae bacterium]